MGHEARQPKTAKELVARECERRHVSRLTRWLVNRPTLVWWIVTISWPLYALTGHAADWSIDRDILSALADDSEAQ